MPAVRALAEEPVHSVQTRAAVPARRASTLVHVHAAILAGEAGLARAPIVVRTRYAPAAVRARFRQAVVDFVLAQSTDVSRHALATKLIDQIHAGPAVQTWIALAVVDVRLASFAGETGRARAPEAVAEVRTGAAVRAWIRGTLVELGFAVVARVTGQTPAHVAMKRVVLAAGSVMAGRISTGSRADLAVSAAPTGWTGATIMLPGGRRRRRRRGRRRRIHGAFAQAGIAVGRVHGARSTVETGIRVTVQKRLLAVGAVEAWRARAGVQTLAVKGVKAGAAVQAGLVIRAIVEVLVAEQTAPAFVAEALPGLLTATVKAAWISHALVAVRSFPAVVASATENKRARCSLQLCSSVLLLFRHVRRTRGESNTRLRAASQRESFPFNSTTRVARGETFFFSRGRGNRVVPSRFKLADCFLRDCFSVQFYLASKG